MANLIRIGLVVFLFIAGRSWGQTFKPALPISVSFEDPFSDQFEKQLLSILNTSLAVVAHNSPTNQGSHLLHWTDSKEKLTGKTVTIVFAKSTSRFMDTLRKGPGGVPKDMDAVTVVPINLQDGKMAIYVCLLVDRIFYDESGAERPDSFARLTLALAHEIFGNVDFYLHAQAKQMKPMDLKLRTALEVKAFRASVKFLEELIRSSDFQTLPPNIQNKFKSLLPKEREALASWESHQCRSIF